MRDGSPALRTDQCIRTTTVGLATVRVAVRGPTLAAGKGGSSSEGPWSSPCSEAPSKSKWVNGRLAGASCVVRNVRPRNSSMIPHGPSQQRIPSLPQTFRKRSEIWQAVALRSMYACSDFFFFFFLEKSVVVCFFDNQGMCGMGRV